MENEQHQELLDKEAFTAKYGEIKEVVVDILDGHTLMESKFVDKDGQILGYWAHGSFEPFMPYQGQF